MTATFRLDLEQGSLEFHAVWEALSATVENLEDTIPVQEGDESSTEMKQLKILRKLVDAMDGFVQG